MNRIGILSLYKNNFNMGGLLQAYALQKAIEKIGVQSEQISFNYLFYYHSENPKVSKSEKLKYRLKNRLKKHQFPKRMKSFQNFMDMIPHSEDCFEVKEISENYSKIIVGSDQVWGDWLPQKALIQFLLEDDQFDKKRYSYAASFGSTHLAEDQKALYQKMLSDFENISLREESILQEVQQLIPNKNITVNCDPTILLSLNEWEMVSKEIKKPEHYIFCYFLGKNRNYREASKIISDNLKLPIYTLPYIKENRNEHFEDDFGDFCDFESGPAEFIDLIKNADLILTDSFHAMLFASRFHKPFYVLARIIEGDNDSNGRILDYLNKFRLREQYITSSELTNIKTIPEIDYSFIDNELINVRNKSKIDLISILEQ